MGMVSDVHWTCPCGKDNIAQLYDDWYSEDDWEPLSHKAIPFRGASLKWNPPCEGCGKYKLETPDYLVELPIVEVKP